jgi:hypothetical protein
MATQSVENITAKNVRQAADSLRTPSRDIFVVPSAPTVEGEHSLLMGNDAPRFGRVSL